MIITISTNSAILPRIIQFIKAMVTKGGSSTFAYHDKSIAFNCIKLTSTSFDIIGKTYSPKDSLNGPPHMFTILKAATVN